MNLEHKKRWISALLGLALLLAIYFFLGHYGVVLISLVISVAAFYEFLSFSDTAEKMAGRWLSAFTAISLSLWLCLSLPGELEAVYLACLVFILRGLWRVHRSSPESLAREFLLTQHRVFALIYLVVFPSFVPKVHALPHGPALLLFLIGIVWLGDIGAYYGGKTMGRHKLSPNISPGKTLEGAMSGIVSCALWAAIYGSWALPHLPTWKLVPIAVLGSLVAQAGDLAESLMKRAFSVKDSGALLPGHGGVFDRFDSLILLAPFFYLLLRLST